MINKCPQADSLLWCCQALAFKVDQGQLTSLSEDNIKGGGAQGSNKGLFDLLLYKRDFRDHLVTWAQQVFRDEDGALSWIQGVVAPKVRNFASWSHVLKSGDVSWRAGRSTAMIQWLNFLVEATFGTAYDESLKLVWKDDPDKAFSGPTFAAVVESIHSKMENPPCWSWSQPQQQRRQE